MMPDHRHSFQSDEPCPYCKKVGKHECNCFAPAQDILQDDLAKRLRSNYHPEYEGDCLLCEAADRIEQLEAECNKLRRTERTQSAILDYWQEDKEELLDRIWQLEVQLELHKDAHDYDAEKICIMDTNLHAIKVYAEGVKNDFPETSVWMNNIIEMTGYKEKE
jgi:hypothetical protein